jgi:hypothetical protein
MGNKPLPLNTKVTFDIADLDKGEGIITAAHYDNGWMYRIQVTSGDDCDDHRNAKGELWLNDFEVKKWTPPKH